MGICDSMNNPSLFSNNNNGNNQVSFRCFYEVKNINEEIQIINDIDNFNNINNEIKSKIKILNGNKKEEIILWKKFNKIGINIIDFIIEGKLINLSYIFSYCESLIKIEFISIDTSNVNNMSKMFYFCFSLEDLDLSNFDTSNVGNMEGMFDYCSKLNEVKGINNFDTSKVKNMSNMFFGCESLEYLDLSNFDISNVETMFSMLYGCSKLKEIKGLNNFNTSKVKNMKFMFNRCISLEDLDLSNFDTSSVGNMEGMFFGCISLEYLDLSNFDTSNVYDMNGMFSCCYKLKEIKGINNFKIKKNCDIERIFHGCKELDYLIISDNKICIDIHKLISKREANEKIISIMFLISEQNIHYPIPCSESDSFSKIELKLFEEFPELKSKNIYYLANGNTINKTATLKENKIKNGDTILINYIDDYN